MFIGFYGGLTIWSATTLSVFSGQQHFSANVEPFKMPITIRFKNQLYWLFFHDITTHLHLLQSERIWTGAAVFLWKQTLQLNPVWKNTWACPVLNKSAQPTWSARQQSSCRCCPPRQCCPSAPVWLHSQPGFRYLGVSLMFTNISL